MKTVNATRAKAGLGYIAALICFFANGLTHAANENTPNPTGKLFVAETDGASTILTEDKILELAPKSVHLAKGSTLETQANASLALEQGTCVANFCQTSCGVKTHFSVGCCTQATAQVFSHGEANAVVVARSHAQLGCASSDFAGVANTNVQNAVDGHCGLCESSCSGQSSQSS